MRSKPKIAVLGSGNAGLTFAADLTLAGFDVNLYDLPRFEENLTRIKEHGGIEVGGACRTGFAKVSRITTDIEEALKGVKVVIVAVPAYGHAAFAEVCSPYLEDGQIVVLNPGYTLGAIEFANVIIEEGGDIEKITLGETNCLVYATRMYLPNRVWCTAVKAKMPFAAFPAKKTMEALEGLNQIYPQDDRRGMLIPATNVLETSIGNINPYYHVPMMILKAVDVELGEEPYLKSTESEACKKLTDAMDKEGLALKRALGLKLLSEHYIHNVLMYPPGSRDPLSVMRGEAEVPEWVKPENQPGLYASGTGFNLLKMRYITEDVPYALVGFSGLGDMLNVPTPVFDSLITIASVITGTDFWREGRTVKKLGIANFTKDELLKYVNEGKI